MACRQGNMTWDETAKAFNKQFGVRTNGECLRRAYKEARMPRIDGLPKVLVYDIETAPMLAYIWRMWDEVNSLDYLQSDWHILSWSAKWLGEPPDQIMYEDQRFAANIEDDKKLLKGIWKLLDEADIVVTQNGKAFDQKKLNARFILNGMQPPSSYKHIDTKLLAKKHFGFTSNRLEYMSKKLCGSYVKSAHKKYPGFDLWKGCLAGEQDAWDEMEKYNKYDVLALEELYTKLAPWDTTVNFAAYSEEPDSHCQCGSSDFQKNGYYYTQTGKFQRYRCVDCGAETRARENLHSAEKRKAMRVGTNR